MQVTESHQTLNLRPVAVPDRTEIHVLVVDDNADDYKAVSRLLSRLDGYTVRTTRASSGIAARKGVASQPV